jgi:hypothetical protein
VSETGTAALQDHKQSKNKTMKKSILLLATIAALALCLPTASHAATQVYDLKTDWSDTQNPNGAWSYHWEDGQLLSNDPFPWTIYSDPSLGIITRTTAPDVIPGYLEIGDIYVSAYYGVVVRWTAPAAGTINGSATAWAATAPETYGSADWALTHNGNALRSSSFIGGTRDLPYDLSSGSGGSSALQNIAVEAGDRIELALQAGSGRIGLNFTITLTTDAFDPVSAIEDLALTVIEMNLQNGIANSLDSKLDAAVDALVDASVNNDGAACNSLLAFINAVEAQRGNKLTNAQADQLIASAQQIKAVLNCAN